MEDLETSATLEFHGAHYIVTVQVQQQLLHVQVEAAAADAAASYVWTGRFPASDIEQLTRQTGNSKRFPVFVQMLLTALQRRSDAVFVDLLTAADLDLYRQRKLQPGAVSEGLTSAATATNTAKRYLILTYAVEFDRVHYPLPLNQEISPSPDVLQRTIRRLRQQLAKKENSTTSESTNRLAEENAALREENRCLKNTLKQYCDDLSGDGFNSTAELQRELETSIEENKELIALYQQFREDSVAETARLRAEIKQLRLSSQQNDRSELAKLEQERLETRRKIKDSSAAVQETLAQMVQMKAQLEETQLKNRELLRQLAIARAQAGQQGTRQRPTSSLNGSRGSDLSRRFTRGRSPSTRPAQSPARSLPRQQQTRAVFPTQFQSSASHYGPSDDEDVGDKTPTSARRRTPTRAAFHRFDPTAYQQEKERKLREARARSNSRTRSNGGYSSDSSVGGYSSAGSRDSKASSRSTRSRSSRLSRDRQRESVTRLSSPKRVLEPPPLRPRASNNSPLPRSSTASTRSLSRGRSPSPTPSTTSRGGRTAPAMSSPRKTPPSTPQKKNREPPVVRRRKQPPQALLDTSADSFSDIDDRLTALQQFLREAKQGAVAGASTAA